MKKWGILVRTLFLCLAFSSCATLKESVLKTENRVYGDDIDMTLSDLGDKESKELLHTKIGKSPLFILHLQIKNKGRKEYIFKRDDIKLILSDGSNINPLSVSEANALINLGSSSSGSGYEMGSMKTGSKTSMSYGGSFSRSVPLQDPKIALNLEKMILTKELISPDGSFDKLLCFDFSECKENKLKASSLEIKYRDFNSDKEFKLMFPVVYKLQEFE